VHRADAVVGVQEYAQAKTHKNTADFLTYLE
jgi:hypothetical protein